MSEAQEVKVSVEKPQEVAELKAEVTGLKTSLELSIEELGKAVKAIKTQSEEVERLQAIQTNIPQQHQAIETVTKSEEPNQETAKYRDMFVKRLTVHGFADEQNDAFKAVIMAPKHMAHDAYQWAAKVGLTDETVYEYEYEEYPDSMKAGMGQVLSHNAKRLKAVHTSTPSYTKAISGLTPASGEILIPRDHLRDIVRKRDLLSIVRMLGARIKTTVNRTIDVPSEDTVLGVFVDTAETAAITEDTPDYTPGVMGIREFTKLTKNHLFGFAR